MQKLNKKEKERRLVSSFIKKLNLDDSQLLAIEDAEGDFLLVHNDRRIAIEATELLYTTPEGFSRMQFKKMCETIVGKAEEIFRKYNSREEIEVRVSFTDKSGLIDFNKNELLKAEDILPLATLIARLSIQNLPFSGQAVLLDHFHSLKLTQLLTDKIERITIDNVTGKWKGFFSTSGGYIA